MLRDRAAKDPDALPPESASVLGYLSPEQAIGSAVDDPRTDVFSHRHDHLRAGDRKEPVRRGHGRAPR